MVITLYGGGGGGISVDGFTIGWRITAAVGGCIALTIFGIVFRIVRRRMRRARGAAGQRARLDRVHPAQRLSDGGCAHPVVGSGLAVPDAGGGSGHMGVAARRARLRRPMDAPHVAA